MLNLRRDASQREIEAAYRSLNPQFLGTNVPYAPRNMSRPDDYWDDTSIRRHRVADAFKDLSDLEEREFWDQPCEWLFGGAMCARRDKSGGMRILVGHQND